MQKGLAYDLEFSGPCPLLVRVTAHPRTFPHQFLYYMRMTMAIIPASLVVLDCIHRGAVATDRGSQRRERSKSRSRAPQYRV